MRKNIKILIISLSVLAVTATVAAIAVPLVMHANNVDDQNSNREITIKSATLVTSNATIQKILKGNSESEMLDIVNSTNKIINGWKGAFKLTNENDDPVNNAIKEVDLAITRGPIVNGEQSIQFAFLITYNDGIKFDGKSSIIRHELQKNIITSLDLVPDSVAKFTNLVNTNLPEIKEDGLQVWLNKESTKPQIAKLLIAKQGSTEVPVYLANSEDITTEGSLRYKIKITPIFNDGSEENSYFLAQNIVLPEIGLEIIELDLENSVDAADKKIAATKVLIDELNFATTIDEQKKLYDGWKTETPFAFKEALNDLLTVTDKPYKWTDILKEIKIIPGTFPTTAGLPIPDVSVQIILKDDFSASVATAGLLKFDITNLEFATKQVSISKAKDFDTKVDYVKTELENLLKAEASIDAEKKLYDSWGKMTPNEIKYGLVDSLIFGGTGNTWDNTVDNIIVKTGTYPNTNNVDIPPLAITIVLKDGLKASEGKEFLKFDITLGKSSNKLTATKSSDYDTKLTNATTVLSKALADAKTLAAQKTLYEGWATTAPAGFADALKDIVKFDGIVTWDDVVAGITIVPGTFISTIDTIIPPVEIKINLNDGYVISNPELLTLKSGDLGKTKSTTDVTVAKASNYDTKLADATKVLRVALNGATTIDAQKTLYNNWGKETPVEFTNALKDIITFDNGGITWETAFDSIVLTPGEFVSAVGSTIPQVGITINLNPAYTATTESLGFLTFKSGDLGTAVEKTTITVSNATDHADKLAAATKVLRGALESETTIDEQKKIYDSWVATTPEEFTNALKDIVTFDGGITWDNAVKGVNITKNSELPATPSTPIPPVKITIDLNTGYEPIGDTGNLLLFDSGDLGNTKNISVTVIKDDANFKEKLDAATKVLRGALESETTIDEQKKIYDGWVTTTPEEFTNALIDIVTFDGKITWETVVKGVRIETLEAFPKTPATKIPPVKITIDLNTGYDATESTKGFLSFESGDLGNTKGTVVTVIKDDGIYKEKLVAATNILKSELNKGSTPSDQKRIYGEWRTSPPAGFEAALKDIVTFDGDETKWDTIVQGVKITIVKNMFDLPATQIEPVKITIELKETYAATSGTESLLSFDSGGLGLTKNINVTVIKEEVNFNNKLAAATKVLREELDRGTIITNQKVIYDGWNKKTPQKFIDALKGIVTFGSENNWDAVVEGVDIKTGIFLETPGVEIPPVTITIKLKAGYITIDDTNKLLSFKSNGLGLTVSIPVPVENAADILTVEFKKR